MSRVKKAYYNILYSFLNTNVGKLIRNKINTYYVKKNKKVLKKCKIPKTYNWNETVDKITNEKVSACRRSDGEFKWMCHIFQWSYQEDSKELASDLKEVISSNDSRILICIPNETIWKTGKTAYTNYWEYTLGKYRRKWYKYIDFNRKYYDSSFNYCYDFNKSNRDEAIRKHNKIKEIWKDRDVLIIEGKLSRIGVGNDSFDNVKSIKRILCPATNAYTIKDKIIEYVQNNIDKEVLLLASLGPTAKIVCYKLALQGYQAIDIGHFDINYEYALIGATSPIPIKNKYSNEASHLGGNIVQDKIDDKEYNSQIIAEIYN